MKNAFAAVLPVLAAAYDTSCPVHIYNQGTNEDCYAFATAGMMNCRGNAATPLSGMWLAECLPSNVETCAGAEGLHGGDADSLISALYADENGHSTYVPPDNCGGCNDRCSGGLYITSDVEPQSSMGSWSTEQIENQIQTEGPVTAQLNAYCFIHGANSWFTTGPGKQWAVFSKSDCENLCGSECQPCGESCAGRHNVLITGYDDTSWHVANSWGGSWGWYGFFKIEKGLLGMSYVPAAASVGPSPAPSSGYAGGDTDCNGLVGGGGRALKGGATAMPSASQLHSWTRIKKACVPHVLEALAAMANATVCSNP